MNAATPPTEIEILSEQIAGLSGIIAPEQHHALTENLLKIQKSYIKKLPEYFQRIGYLKYLATNPKTIIDVGVQAGTPILYKAFEDIPFILVDPQKGCENLLKSKPNNYRFVEKGLGAKPGILTLNESGSQSSFVERDGVFANDYAVKTTYDVEVITLAQLVQDMNLEPPFGIKIDTEGFELEVVKGMVGIFDKVDFLICETSVRRVYADSYQFSELVAFLADHGLLFYNILNEVSPWPRYYDVAFLRHDHPKFTSVT